MRKLVFFCSADPREDTGAFFRAYHFANVAAKSGLEAEVRLAGPAGHVTVVANKVASEDDDARVRLSFAGFDVATVPNDPVVVKADRQGISPIDLDAGAPAVAAIGQLVGRLTG